MKRARGEGSITQRGDSWSAEIMVTVDGERHRIRRSGHTRTEALHRRDEAVELLRAGKPTRDSSVTVAQFYGTWVEGPLRSGRSQSTRDQYARLVRVHVLPRLGRTAVAKVRPSAIEGVLLDVETRLAASSRRSLYAALRSLFAAAERDGLTRENPVEKVKRPTALRPKPRALTGNEVRALLAQAEGHRWEPTVGLLAGTGLRRGELLGLRWGDVDLDRGELTVSRSLSRASDGLRERSTKSEAGRRVIPLSAPVVELLRRHRAAQVAERLAAPSWEDPELLFTSEIGTVVDPRNWSNWYARLAERAGVSDHGAHALRHYAATAMLASGATVRDVADVLGHSSPVVTLEIYARAVPEAQRKAVEAASRVLG